MKVCALACKDNINDDWFEAGTPRPKQARQRSVPQPRHRRLQGGPGLPPPHCGRGCAEGSCEEACSMALLHPTATHPSQQVLVAQAREGLFFLTDLHSLGISTGKTFQYPTIHQMEHLWVWADAHVGSGANTCCSHRTGMLGQRAFLGQFAKCTARSTKVLAKMFLV